MILLPKKTKEESTEGLLQTKYNSFLPVLQVRKTQKSTETLWSFVTLLLAVTCLLLIFINNASEIKKTISPLVASFTGLHPIKTSKKGYEVFGFAPYWTFNNLDNVDFNTLTTFSYFGVPVDSDGNFVTDDPGYTTYISDQATQIFKKAHDSGTKVLLTLTQMDNDTISTFLSSPDAQANAINQTVAEVKRRGIDGVNIDFEYLGDPGPEYRTQFSQFIASLSTKMHAVVPGSKVTVSVYALSARDPKLYDIASIGNSADEIFMMAYDFAVAGSDYAQPTAPLHGYQQGKYSYDVATAVDDFLKLMPANKLILGVPYYGYNYVVTQPGVNSETYPYYSWKGTPTAQQYNVAEDNISPQMDDVDAYTTGWDTDGEVGYKAYHIASTDTWREVFIEDTRSLGAKYDFAKSKNLLGVGIWALGFDQGHSELWSLLSDKFGTKLADSKLLSKDTGEN